MSFCEKLDKTLARNNSHIVVGLDTDEAKIPEIFRSDPNPVLAFNREIIRATRDYVAGYKLNMAFYEFLEEKGIEALRGSLAEIPSELITICDAKRGDLGNTAELYARTYLDKYDFDSMTVNAYMGYDSVMPYLERAGKLIFILALTSNESSAEFQFAQCEGKNLYELILEKSIIWDKGKGNIGFVFGANHTKQIEEFTKANPEIPLLIPGVGAQGHEVTPLIKSLNTNRYLINASRSVIYSAPGNADIEEFKETVINSVLDLNKQTVHK